MVRSAPIILMSLLCTGLLAAAADYIPRDQILHKDARELQANIDCDNIQPWNRASDYDRDDQVVRRNDLYTARRDNRGDRPGGNRNRDWDREGRCPPPPPPPVTCTGVSNWTRTTTYQRGDEVTHDRILYTARRTNRGNNRMPTGQRDRNWDFEGPCHSNPTPTVEPTSSAAPTTSAAPTIVTPSAVPTATPTNAPATSVERGAAVCLKTNGAPITPTAAGICTAYAAISDAFSDLVTGPYRPQNELARSNLFGQTVRYTFHDAGEIDVTNNGDNMRSDGCLSNTAENAGLIEDTSLIVSVTDPIWQEHCDLISRADFYVMFGKLVVEEARSPASTIVLDYNFGRVDTQSCSAGEGRLPNAQQGTNHLRQIFETQMGLTLADGVTLSGAHTLGHVHEDNSGYTSNRQANNVRVNAWDNSPAVFDNRYWDNMINVNWDNDFVQRSGNTLNIWNDRGGDIMLNTDMALAFNIDLTGAGQSCGGRNQRCNNPNAGTSGTFAQANRYRTNEQSFFDDFTASFRRMTSVGYGASLTDIDLDSCPA